MGSGEGERERERRPVWSGGRRQPPCEPMPELGMRKEGDDGGARDDGGAGVVVVTG